MVKKEKNSAMILKTVTFMCEMISIYLQTGKTLYKLHLTKILKIRFFDRHPITSKQE